MCFLRLRVQGSQQEVTRTAPVQVTLLIPEPGTPWALAEEMRLISRLLCFANIRRDRVLPLSVCGGLVTVCPHIRAGAHAHVE